VTFFQEAPFWDLEIRVLIVFPDITLIIINYPLARPMLCENPHLVQHIDFQLSILDLVQVSADVRDYLMEFFLTGDLWVHRVSVYLVHPWLRLIGIIIQYIAKLSKFVQC
jgi:hypothetical protein